jgi:hypothetical protein
MCGDQNFHGELQEERATTTCHCPHPASRKGKATLRDEM